MCCREEAEIPHFSVLIEFSFPPRTWICQGVDQINQWKVCWFCWLGRHWIISFISICFGFQRIVLFSFQLYLLPCSLTTPLLPFCVTFWPGWTHCDFPLSPVPSYLLRLFMLRLLVLGPSWWSFSGRIIFFNIAYAEEARGQEAAGRFLWHVQQLRWVLPSHVRNKEGRPGWLEKKGVEGLGEVEIWFAEIQGYFLLGWTILFGSEWEV